MVERPILFSAPMVRAILSGAKTQTRRPVKGAPPPRDGERITWCVSSTDKASRDSLFLGWPDPEGNTHTSRGRESRFGPLRSPCMVGDHLWVREAFRLRADQDHKPPSGDWWKDSAWYEADPGGHSPTGCAGGPGKLRPSIHMPRWASRITLDVVGVRLERLHEITESDAKAEGVAPMFSDTKIAAMPELESCRGCYDNYLWHGHFGGGLGNSTSDRWPYQFSGYNDARGSFSSLWELTYGTWDANPLVWVCEFRRVEVPRG